MSGAVNMPRESKTSVPVQRLEVKRGNKWVPLEFADEVRVVKNYGRGRPPKPQRLSRPVTCALEGCKVKFLPKHKLHRFCRTLHKIYSYKRMHRKANNISQKVRNQKYRAKTPKNKYEYVIGSAELKPDDSVDLAQPCPLDVSSSPDASP